MNTVNEKREFYNLRFYKKRPSSFVISSKIDQIKSQVVLGRLGFKFESLVRTNFRVFFIPINYIKLIVSRILHINGFLCEKYPIHCTSVYNSIGDRKY